MHPVAKRCVQWSIGLIVSGALLIVFVPRIFAAIAVQLGETAESAVTLTDVVLTLVRWTSIPVGASLIGAAVVIATLAPNRSRHDEASPDRLADRNGPS